ncbi:CBF-domain-containing protein [Aspergillus heteromorphus CBS 117.55]|uniref:CBF-domain-containing protein n=1 Tax=Aspergillus heteromorphus CBS 117.55 TaxID=1448321 RepID=A0A317W7W9_9EURO|nr:CBF-domain-containing protein [Aspergillus heteromorphus CBS 117.55]PWY81985.1 CBF-domain-containing protein [Aspergillus heteromorphus CBS 117.55]
MAKGKGKRSSGANEAIPDGGVAVNDSTAGADALPQFAEGAFAGLRQKIEQRLKAQNDKSKANKGKPAPKEAPKKNDARKPEPKQAFNNDKNNKGKKRDRSGEVIAREDKKDFAKGKQPVSKKDDQDDILRQEILALGGTEEDLDLIAGVGSDSEVEDAAETKPKSMSDDASLRKELSSMLAAAGQVVPDDLEDDEVEEEEEEEEEDEEEEEEEETGEEEDELEQGEDEASEEEVSVDEPAPAPALKESAKKEVAKKEAAPAVIFPKEFAKLTVMPRSDWYNTELPAIPPVKANSASRHVMERLHTYAVSLLEQESKMYAEAQQASASSSHKFYSTIMSTGTLSDKISALTLAVQESPLHNTKALENLIALGKKRSRAQAVEVLRSLKDMFAQGTLLPGDRRLRAFANQPSLIAALQEPALRWYEGDALPGGLENSHLIVWAFENFLKDQFFEVLKILEVWCNDEIEFSRSRAVSYVFELLKEKPEQEANLLRLLVNKLGDTSKKIASRASYLLLQLEQAHPMMKPTIIAAVEEVLFRPGQSQHARYYAIITLNQTVLSLKEEQVGHKLLDIYFAVFVGLLKPSKERKGKNGKFGNKHKGKGKGKGDKGNDKDDSLAQSEEVQDKLTSAVLTGVNRAYPFTSSDTDRLSKHIDTLFRITHSANFNTCIQALMLIQQLTSAHQVGSERFYRTLYESLLDPRVTTSSKQSLYLNLLFKALKNDMNTRRVKAFVKRIIQVLGLHQPAFICGVLYLIRELEKTFPDLASLFDQPEENDSDDEEVFRDVPDEDDEPLPVVPEQKSQKPSTQYDPRKRDPEHSNADRTCLWELLPYVSHFHPSVSVNAAHLLDHKPMSGQPDLTIHTLSHFLDRFVYRTPKASALTRGSSIMQPLAGSEAKDRLVSGGKHIQHLPLNSEAFWKKKSEDVAAEDVFFHEYFSRIGKGQEKDKTKKKGKDAADADADEDEASEAESEIWKALVDSRPDLEAGSDDDDLDMDDLESAYDQSEDEGEGGDDEVELNLDSDDEMEDVDEAEVEAPPSKTKAKKAKAAKEEEPSDDEDPFDMDVSDDEAFFDSDEDLPSDVELTAGMESPKEEEKDEKQSERKKRRKLKHLPTFASADDYAALLAGEDEGM